MGMVAMVHATRGALNAVEEGLSVALPNAEVIHVMDEGLLRDLLQKGEMSPGLVSRFCRLVTAAAESSPDVILTTCSSFAEFVDTAQAMVSMPVLKPDGAMIEKVVQNWTHVVMVATAPSAIPVAEQQLAMAAKDSEKNIEIDTILIPEALEALKSGDRERHDQLIVDALRGRKDADGIMLCQFTMAHLEERISHETGVATISSLRSALQKVAALLEQPVE